MTPWNEHGVAAVETQLVKRWLGSAVTEDCLKDISAATSLFCWSEHRIK